MSKFLKIFAPAMGGTASVLAMAYILADQFVVDVPAPLRDMTVVAPASAQETADTSTAPADEPVNEAAAIATAWTEPSVPSRDGGFGLGREALPEEVSAWDIDVRPDGLGLPVGSGDVWTGEEVFVENCAMCHGDFGEAVGRWPVLAGGRGTLTREDPVKTIGSYWPYLSTVYDYVRRAMPFGNAQSLSDDDVYAITAYLLYVNDLVDEDFTLSNENFLEVEMPNAGNFYNDDRLTTEFPVFSAEPCMTGCKDSVEITMHASVLDVTPDTTVGDAPVAEEASAEAPEQAEAEPTAEATPAEETDAAPAAADPALVAAGEAAFRRCSTCHQVGDTAVNRTGPVLNGIVGGPVGVVEGFRYSSVFAGFTSEGRVWSPEALAEFLANPRSYAPGTRMSFAGLSDPEEIAAITAYLSTFE